MEMIQFKNNDYLPDNFVVTNVASHYEEKIKRFRFFGSSGQFGEEKSIEIAQYELKELYYGSYLNFPKDRMHLSSYNMLDSSIKLPINDYLPYHISQYSNSSFEKKILPIEKEIRWIQCTNGLFIPAFLVFWDYPYSDYFDSDSNGLACGKNFDHATSHGVNELIERDVLSKFWYSSKFQVQKVTFDSPNEDLIQLCKLPKKVKELKTYFIQEINDLSKFVFLTVIVFEFKNKSMYSFGASSSNDIESAILGSIKESYKNILFLINNLKYQSFDYLKLTTICRSYLEHTIGFNKFKIRQKILFKKLNNALDVKMSDIKSSNLILLEDKPMYFLKLYEDKEICITRSWSPLLSKLTSNSSAPALKNIEFDKNSPPHFFP